MTTKTTASEMPLSHLADGDGLDRILVARDIERRSTRRGSGYLRLVLADRCGSVPAVMWEPPEGFEAASLVHVVGRFAEHPRYGRQIIVSSLVPAEPQEADLAALVAGPREESAELERRLDAVVEAVDDAPLRLLLDRLIGPQGTLRGRFVGATAARYNHHAYPGGLLEHSLQVAETVAAAARVHHGVDPDLAVAGALLHDVGKLEAYDEDPLDPDLTDAGRLEGEIPLGYFLVRSEIGRIVAFPARRARELLHVILSHHGRLEHGSPVVPGTREAALVHTMDKLSGLRAVSSVSSGRPHRARSGHASITSSGRAPGWPVGVTDRVMGSGRRLAGRR
ncbi:MAG: HD domain-containing protein [Dehalococcoidia bacterium]